MRRIFIRISAGIASLFLLANPALSSDTLPIGEPDDFKAVSIEGLRITAQAPGGYNRPGSLTFSFRVDDINGDFYPALTGNRLKITCGGRPVTGFILSRMPDRYSVVVPRVPYQEKNGAYDLRLVVDPQKDRIEAGLPGVVLYRIPRLNLILVIDSSTSMRLNDPANFRVKAVNNIVRYGRLLNIIDKVALVKFGSTAELLCPLTSVRNGLVIETAALRIDSSGETDIADGLLKAYAEALKAGKGERTIVILLTDGENNYPYDAQHMKFAALGIPVFTIGLTKNVNNRFLDTISRETGGEYYQVPDSFSILSVYNRIVQDELGHRVLIDNEIVLRPGQKTNLSLDPGLNAKKVNMVVSWEGKKPLLRYPESMTRANVTSFTGFQYFELQNPASAGRIGIENSSAATNRFSLIGYISSSLAVLCQMPKKTFDLDEPVEFTVTSWQDDRPLAGCKVSVAISSKKTNMTIRLSDDGRHNDSDPSDGLYRNYAFGLQPGEYRATFTIRGTDLLNNPFKRTSSKKFFVSDKPIDGPEAVPGSVTMDRAGAVLEYFQSFRLVSRDAASVPLRVFCLPFNREDSGTNVSVTLKPSHFVLEKDRFKLFNVSVVFPPSFQSGVYSSRIVLVEPGSFHSIPLDIDFYKYLLPDTQEKTK